MGGCVSKKGQVENVADAEEEKDRAILNLKREKIRLQKYQSQQESIAERELQTAKELVRKGDKKKALIVMRQKKQREVIIEKTANMISNYETQINDIETAHQAIEMAKNLEQTNALLKQMTELMPVEEVERIMDENAEQQDKLNEIESVLYQNMNKEDMEAADEEYEALLQQIVGEDEGNEEQPADEQEEQEPEAQRPARVAVAA